MTSFVMFLGLLSFYVVASGKEFRIKSTNNLYTLHLNYTTWHEAKRICEAEGAALFVPENEVEAQEVQSVVPETERSHGPWVGVFSYESGGSAIYETIDGRSLSVVFNTRYSRWEEGPEKCLVLTTYTDLNSRDCDNKWFCICKFPLTTTHASTITKSSDIETTETLSHLITEDTTVTTKITLSDITTETTFPDITTEDIAVSTDNHQLELAGKLCGDVKEGRQPIRRDRFFRLPNKPITNSDMSPNIILKMER